jgi:hypothetical protein
MAVIPFHDTVLVEPGQIEALQQVASGQHGLFTTAQAEELAISRSALRQAAARGWIRRVRRSVYAFVGQPPSRWEAILAASLSTGPCGVISHGAAASVHRFWGAAQADPELTLIGTARRHLDGVTIHRSTTMRPEDIVRRCGVEVTSPIRTLIDVAPFTNDHVLPRIIDEGSIARLWTAEELEARLTFATPSWVRPVSVACLRSVSARDIRTVHSSSGFTAS